MGILSRLFNGARNRGASLGARADKVKIGTAEPATGAMLRAGGATYDVEREYDEYGLEQQAIWRADGTKASRSSHAKAEGVGPQAATVHNLVDSEWARVQTSGTAFDEMSVRLRPFAPRRPFEARRYAVTWVGLVLGDIAGVFGAALTYGEVPINALGQAISSGTAAVTAGLVGADVKAAHIAKAIRATSTDDELAAFGLLGVHSTERATYGLVLRVAAAVATAVFVAILALRTAIEGFAGGLVFGGLSFAVAAASFINAWVHANPAADLLAAYEHAHEQAKAAYLALGADPALAEEAAAQAEAALIEAEHDERGRAVRHFIEALKWGILRRHPQIFGHGMRTEDVERRAFHNGNLTPIRPLERVPLTSLGPVRIGRRVVRPVARSVRGSYGRNDAH